MERSRMIWLFMKERGLPHPGAKVLHVAPEKCIREKITAMPRVDYVIGDKHEPGYTYPSGTMELDITNMEFPDKHFDLIICSHVLEHVDDDRRAMRELVRVLAPGGSAILIVPMGTKAETYEDPSITDPGERLRHFGQFDHVRIYGLDFPQRLEEAGFQVEELAFADRFSSEEIFRYGLRRGELMHIGTHPTV
ncbi:MAG: methyltransferase domain-containing protein [Flavobacteriales bacterium]|jgi:SAM-dependent methyltransferase|nr:methyltransferase domain-containing protein [Flavobacteriales bacterium]